MRFERLNVRAVVALYKTWRTNARAHPSPSKAASGPKCLLVTIIIVEASKCTHRDPRGAYRNAGFFGHLLTVMANVLAGP